MQLSTVRGLIFSHVSQIAAVFNQVDSAPPWAILFVKHSVLGFFSQIITFVYDLTMSWSLKVAPLSNDDEMEIVE